MKKACFKNWTIILLLIGGVFSAIKAQSGTYMGPELAYNYSKLSTETFDFFFESNQFENNYNALSY